MWQIACIVGRPLKTLYSPALADTYAPAQDPPPGHPSPFASAAPGPLPRVRRGNSVDVLRTIPSRAIELSCYEWYKRVLRWGARLPAGSPSRPNWVTTGRLGVAAQAGGASACQSLALLGPAHAGECRHRAGVRKPAASLAAHPASAAENHPLPNPPILCQAVEPQAQRRAARARQASGHAGRGPGGWAVQAGHAACLLVWASRLSSQRLSNFNGTCDTAALHLGCPGLAPSARPPGAAWRAASPGLAAAPHTQSMRCAGMSSRDEFKAGCQTPTHQ